MSISGACTCHCRCRQHRHQENHPGTCHCRYQRRTLPLLLRPLLQEWTDRKSVHSIRSIDSDWLHNTQIEHTLNSDMCSSWLKPEPRQLSTSFYIFLVGYAWFRTWITAPRSIESSKSCESANPYNVRTWWVLPCYMLRKDACVIWWRLIWNIGPTTPHNSSLCACA